MNDRLTQEWVKVVFIFFSSQIYSYDPTLPFRKLETGSKFNINVKQSKNLPDIFFAYLENVEKGKLRGEPKEHFRMWLSFNKWNSIE